MAEAAPISVVIPCHNCVATLQRAFDSVLAQTLRPAQVVLVDDASGDGTRALLGELASRHPDWVTTVLLDANQGPSAARNAGWERASQPCIAFLDADDAWHPQKLALQYAWMAAHPDAAMCGHLCGEYQPGFDAPVSGTPAVTAFTLNQMLISNRFSTPTVMLRRDIPQRFPTTKRHSEDYHLWLSIAAHHGPLYRIDAMLAWFYKPAYGASGLSGALWAMEKGELDSISMLRREGKLPVWHWAAMMIFSLLKFSLRLLRTRLRKTR
jgi:glycosyltransferase involved in cell wall biosynthesis